MRSRLPQAKTAHERTVIERQSEATDRETGRLVYDLYVVSDDEIKIVEAATGASIGSLPVPSPRRGRVREGGQPHVPRQSPTKFRSEAPQPIYIS
jgi:hypothetical protein